ncbi:MAG: 1-acyl-sn-glycerol-3-phosphate acyltransferase [Anaerolineae bacterium]|jgi:1-acyl-sn-glycerol-3-phosphate acyltransferase|nr:1-acyl-sn-glycerol-3-phosphate acyltransferase [Anaerolineae bacterium]
MPSLTIEEYIARQPAYTWRRFLLRAIIRTVGYTFLAKVSSTGKHHIPKQGGCILMMSHISAIDPVVCMGEITNRYVIPMTKIENTQSPILRFFVWWWGSYTINRETVDRRALETSIALLKAGNMILVAPEGTRHPEGMGEAKDGLAFIATKSDAIILPAAISDTNTFRTRWKNRNRALAQVSFGKPFKFKTDGRSHIPREELRLMTQEAMYQLAMIQPRPELRGIFSDINRATTTTLQFLGE